MPKLQLLKTKTEEKTYQRLKTAVLDSSNYEYPNDKAAKALIDFIEVVAEKPIHRLLLLNSLLCGKSATTVLEPFQYLDSKVINEIKEAFEAASSEIDKMYLKTQIEEWQQ